MKIISNCIISISIILFASCKSEHSRQAPIINAVHEMLVSNGTPIHNIDITDINGDSITLGALVSEKSKTIICLYNLDCTSCAEKEIRLLNSFITPEYKDKIIVIGNFSSTRQMKVFQNNLKIKAYCDRDAKLMEDIDIDNYIFIFRLDSGMKAYSILDLIEYPQLSRIYYDTVIKNKNE